MHKNSLFAAAGLVLASMICVVFGVFTPSWVVNIWYSFHVGMFAWLGTALIIAGIVALAIGDARKGHSESNPMLLLAVLLFTFGILSIFPGQSYRAFLVDSVYYESMSQETTPVFKNGFETRFVHYDNAQTQIQNDMGEFHGTTLTNITYVGDATGARWTAIADGQMFQVPLKAVIVYYPDGRVERCSMPGVDVAIQGSWNHSLLNKIRWEDWFVYFSKGDIYGDCVNGHGKIYIPFKQLRGFLGVPYPYGLAVIDEYGDLSMYYDNIPTDTPGPYYPESIAMAQQNSINTANGYVDWLFGNYGFEETGGTDDPNNENAGQYNLRLLGSAEHFYVTPLTAKGSSRSIVGITVISTQGFESGRLSSGLFVKYPEPKTGLRDLADNTKSFFDDWQWINLEVQEIVPADGDTYVGYVGRPTRLDYIVTYKPDGIMTAVRVSPEISSENAESEPVVVPSGTEIPVDVVNTPDEFGVGGSCDYLFEQLVIASQLHDISKVLLISSQLLENNCK